MLRADELTDLADRGLRRRLQALEKLPQRSEPTKRAVQYYRVMIATHYDYLCYGRVIAMVS